ATRLVAATAGIAYLPEVRTPSRTFAFGLTAGWLGACAAAVRGPHVGISFCGKLLVGAIHSVVFGPRPVAPGDRPWGGGALTAQLRLRVVDSLFVELGGDLILPFVRQHFDIAGQIDPVFQENPVCGDGFLSLGVSIR
ncbi:MAG: hypothetical protein M3O36_14555, partial [Myxococcota bacterium]|nr:hypothetical protein [Myxococcota bacterium]